MNQMEYEYGYEYGYTNNRKKIKLKKLINENTTERKKTRMEAFKK